MKKVHLILKISLSLIFLNASSVWAQTAAEYLHLGNVSGRQDKYPDAILNYTKAIESDPNFASAYYNRGYIYIKIKKYKMALADLDKALELRPKFAAAYHVRGMAYFYKKKYAQAIADYSRSIELDPNNINTYYSRLSVYFRLGNNDRAWKDVIKIQELGGTVNPSIINLLKDKKYREKE